MNFIEALTRELHTWPDEAAWLSYDVVAETLARAAAEVLGEKPPTDITLRRAVEPDDLSVWTVLEFGADHRVILGVQDVATLRALLLTWDENRPARVGDPLMIPARLGDGRVVSEVVPELLNED